MVFLKCSIDFDQNDVTWCPRKTNLSETRVFRRLNETPPCDFRFAAIASLGETRLRVIVSPNPT